MIELAEELLSELESGWLQVMKIPGRDGIGYIRVAASTNCEWYRRLCNRHLGYRRKRYTKPRTIIKRQTTVEALRRMAAGKCEGIYAERILEVVNELGIFEKSHEEVPF